MSGSDKRTVTIPTPVQPLVDEGDQITVPWRAWAKWTQSGVVQIADLATRLAILEARMGVTDGSDAAPGVVGEYTSAVAGGVTVSDTIVTNIVSLDLAAGDWEVFGNVVFVLPAGAYTLLGVGMGSVDSYITVSFLSPSDQAMNTMSRRYNLTATTTVWLVAEAFSSGGAVTASGFIQARRMR